MQPKSSEVKPFSFQSLTPKVAHVDSESFEFRSLAEAGALKNKITDEIIRLERQSEKESNFSIFEHVREYRGLKKQEIEDYERQVEEEVEHRLAQRVSEKEKEGYEVGREEGYNQALDDANKIFAEKISNFESMLINLQENYETILDDNKNQAYQMVRNLTKWVILKEIDTQGYLSRLLEKLILEMKMKQNLLVKVNKSSFGEMEHIIQVVEERVGKLTNIRVEVDYDQDAPGIVLESENGIIDGSLEAQFKSIDELFEKVGVSSDDS